MSNDYKPGTVAKATVRGVPDVTVFRFADGDWALDREIEPADFDWIFKDIASDTEVTDVRPLVVLDLDGLVRPDTLVNWFRHNPLCGSIAVAQSVADQIEAQTRPPRIPEPGKYAIVRARATVLAECEWVNEGRYWTSLGGDPRPHTTVWANLKDPVLVREGINS
jgi:hypothetical protein